MVYYNPNMNTANSERTAAITKAGIIGITVNALLAGSKILIGFAANSITVMSDGFNNFSDCISSIITVISSRLAQRAPDAKHPHGYGRLEYLAGLAVAILIMWTGWNLFCESVSRIFVPEKTEFSITGIIILVISVIVKFLLSAYHLRTGKKYNSDVLIGSGQEQRIDIIQSIAALICVIVVQLTDLNADAYVAAVVSLLLMRTGNTLLKNAVNSLLGERTDTELSRKIYEVIRRQPEFLDAYHLILHNYGPLNQEGSVHIALPDHLSLDEAVRITEHARRAVRSACGIDLNFDIHSVNTTDPAVLEAREYCEEKLLAMDGARQMRAFDYSTEYREIRFTALVEFTVRDYRAFRKELSEKILEKYPDTAVLISVEPFTEN